VSWRHRHLRIPPTEPKTDYGYIRPGSERIGPVQKVAAFVEKPNAQTALRYIAEGLLWNSGNFLFPPELLLSEMARSSRQWRPPPKKLSQGQEDRHDRCSWMPIPSPRRGQVDRLRRHGAHRKCWVVPAKFAGPTRHLGRAARYGEADSAGNVTEVRSRSTMCATPTSADGPLTA